MKKSEQVKQRVFEVLKQNALEVPGGLRGQPVDLSMLAIGLDTDLLATPEELRQALLDLASDGCLAILPPKEGDSHDFWVRIPLTAAERQRRSRALRKRSGLKTVTVYLPEGKTQEETAAREAELKAWINERWGKEPSLI